MISPKVIDVDGNRIGNDILKRNIPKEPIDNLVWGSRNMRNWESVGRFPTQLFTNIKNNQFKYVKNIT